MQAEYLNGNSKSFREDQSSTTKKPAPILKIGAFEGYVSEQEHMERNDSDPDIFRDKFLKSIMDQKKDYSLPVPVINIIQNGETLPFLTLKSFSLWQGKQKSKKTTVLALAVAAFIRSGNSRGTIEFIGSIEGTVLFFDNEQGESYAARTMKLILKLAGVETSSKLIYCDLREYSPSERKKIIEAGIQNTADVKLVVIDGLVDLLNDFMDAGEGHLTITDILKLCSVHNIHIAGVLHQNKADKNARAHVGSISSQKCEMEISTEVDSDDRAQSVVTCVNSRGMPFEPFAIRWDKGSLPRICQDWNAIKSADAKAKKNYERNKKIAESVFKPLTSLSHKDSIDSIMNITSMSKSTAKRLLGEFLIWGLIVKGEDSNYRINNNEGSGVHKGSNGVHEPVQ